MALRDEGDEGPPRSRTDTMTVSAPVMTMELPGRRAASLGGESTMRPASRPGGTAGLDGRIETTEVEELDPLAGGAWDRLLSEHPAAGPFHSAAWARVLSQTYGHEPNFLRLVRDGRTLALVPVMEVRSWIRARRGVCMPFSDLTEPLVFGGGDPEILQACLADVARRKQWKFLELRGSGFALGCGEAPECAASYCGHRLVLREDAGSLFSAFSASTRRAIRKSERSGLQVRISRSWESMRAFVHLHERTRRRHGAPPQPRVFFRHLHQAMIESAQGFVALAEGAGQPLAAAVFLRFGSSAVYKFGASDPAAWSSRPNNLVMWEAIRSLAESGCRSLHFGRTRPEQEGLKRFKSSWGAREEPIIYRRFDVAAGAWRPTPGGSPGRSAAVFKRLPLVLNRIAGSLAYRHLD